MIKKIISIFILVTFPAFAFIHTRTPFGDKVQWASSINNLFLNLDTGSATASNASLSSNDILNIVNSSAAQWSGDSGYTINVTGVSDSNIDNRNDIYFSTSSSIFTGSGILAVTQVVFDEENGNILEADIVINDNQSFSVTPRTGVYLGDIITHEMGHFIGLAHSQVHDSTMIYSAFYGQDTLASDDIAAAQTKKYSGLRPGVISGKIIGGDNVGIFGANVSAISNRTGRIAANVISETNGNFSITGLPVDDIYYIYISPLKAVSTLPDYFKNYKSNFCSGSQNFRGSFYQGCLNSQNGRPYGIELTSSSTSKSVGNITIRCDFPLNSNYTTNKGSVNTIDLDNSTGAGIKQTGYFTPAQITSNEQDQYQFDLSNYDVPVGDLYLEIKLVSQSLYSPFRYSINASGPVLASTTFPDPMLVNADGLLVDNDGNPDLGVVAYLPLTTGFSSNNVFDVDIIPYVLNSTYVAGTSFSYTDFFPAASYFLDNAGLHLLIGSIVSKSGSSYSLVEAPKDSSLNGNSSCTDATNAYAVEPFLTINSSNDPILSSNSRKDDSFLSCGTIDLDGSSGGQGPLSFVIGILLIFLLQLADRSARSFNRN